MAGRDEILANFQACSGIEDVGEAFMHLEAANWNLLEALQVVMPQEGTPATPLPPPPLQSVSQPEVISVDSSPELHLPPPIPPLPAAIPSTSAASLPSSSNTSAVLDVNIQILEGFKTPVEDSTVITAALLPESRTLTLNAQSSVTFDNYYERINGALGDEYLLLIHDESNSKDYNLRFPGSKRIKEIKSDIHDLTNIAATLASSGISKQHHLTVRKAVKERTPKAQRKTLMETGEENSSGDEFLDASELLNDDDDFLDMMDVPAVKKAQTLIPADVDDEVMGVMHFSEEFRNRYGSCVPMFYQGSLEDALKESVQLPAKNRKLLAVYLHHDGSVLSNVFCSQALCQISVVDYLSANFVVWGWDLTHEANKARLLNLVTTHFGSMASSTVRSFSVDKLPALLVITRTRGTIEVLSVIHGNGVLDEVMTALLHATEMFEEQRATEVQEEEAREVREAVKAEQDAAYMESLKADRAKAAAKKQAEMEEKQERERVESIKQQEEAIKEAVRASLETDIPQEPSSDCPYPVATLRFRIPGGETFSRNFLANTTLQVLLNFLHVKGYPADEYKCLQSWPRRDVSALDVSKTLMDYKLYPQETLNIEER
ncbi:FAS-associated factor 1-like [Homarus americanus]|uniref:FAS-associated factor 1-like n=1 Tax=Homarus americanus TaxID=6706 RepID=A0A8J5JVV0_HOMAM|nr:FAS-associated factor 1-like [Homarus americanus]